MLGYTWGGSGALFQRAQQRRRSPEDRAFDYPRYLAATGGLDWEDFVTPNQGATPIVGRAQTALYEQTMDRLRRDGVQDFVATGMGASPVLGRAQQYLDAERAAAMGGGGATTGGAGVPGRYLGADMVYDQGTGMEASPVLGKAQQYLGAERAAAMGGGSLPTGMGATPILGRARQNLSREFWNTPSGNAPKIESALTSEAVPALARGSGVATLPDPWQDSATVPRQAATAGDAGPPARYFGADMVYDQGTGEGATPLGMRNMSDGGPGTSTAKGQAAIEKKVGMRRRLLGMVEGALSSPDLGIGYGAQRLFDRGAAAVGNDSPKLATALTRMGKGARFLAPAAAFAAPLIPAATGALEGYGEAGVGGALIQGGTSAAGSVLGGMAAGALIGSAVPGIGTVIGAGLGAIGGSFVGKGLTGLAQGAVEKAQMGDMGPMGSIGRGLDAFIDTPYEKEQKAILQQMNSPAMAAIRMQEETRRLREESARRQMVFEQAALQGLLG